MAAAAGAAAAAMLPSGNATLCRHHHALAPSAVRGSHSHSLSIRGQHGVDSPSRLIRAGGGIPTSMTVTAAAAPVIPRGFGWNLSCQSGACHVSKHAVHRSSSSLSRWFHVIKKEMSGLDASLLPLNSNRGNDGVVLSRAAAAAGGGGAPRGGGGMPRAAAADVATASDLAALNEKFAVGDSVRVEPGEGGLPKVVLTHRSGSSAEAYLLGACLTSWRLPGAGGGGGEEVLYVRPDAVFTGEKPISGGIPHCFPQFGPGKMQQHGFARNLTWQIGSTSADVNPDEPEPAVELILEDNDYTRSMWDASFRLVYMISLKPDQLVTNLRVINTGEREFDFTTALHTYLRAASAVASVKGLNGCRYLDKDPDPINPRPGVEDRDAVGFPGFVDRMYLDVPKELVLQTGLGRSVGIEAIKGWQDAVLWNPHLTMKNFYTDFVCVESAKLEKVVLPPGDTWHAEMKLTPA